MPARYGQTKIGFYALQLHRQRMRKRDVLQLRVCRNRKDRKRRIAVLPVYKCGDHAMFDFYGCWFCWAGWHRGRVRHQRIKRYAPAVDADGDQRLSFVELFLNLEVDRIPFVG